MTTRPGTSLPGQQRPERLGDRLLDRTIVPGYSALGYRIRRRSWSIDDPAPEALVGKRAIVTGAGSGLGEAAALGLARLGARVTLVVRSRERAAPAVARIEAALVAEGKTPDLDVVLCDVSDLSDVRRCASELRAAGDAIDVLVHNAGTLPAERSESVDGHELTVATHVLGPVLLTELLRPLLAGDEARVVLVASGGMYAQELPVDDPEFVRGRYSGTAAYARSKRMQVSLAPLLAERWAADGIAVYAMHPGWADTPGVASSLPVFRILTKPILRDAEAGADTIVWLAATEPRPESTGFWHDRVARPEHYRDATRESDEDRRTLWAWVASAVGIAPEQV
ncbi:MAG: dehydrogenase/reductase [Marmoricola sp.]|nr:dehydrogenase/reductase [Marmoricola sp.]